MSIADNLKQINDNIASACARSNQNPDNITLVAVSKKKPVADILEAVKAGQQHFGENRVEESEAKIPQVNKQVEQSLKWHMIGHIQSRKAKTVAPIFDIIHSLDSVKLAQKLSRITQDNGQTLDVLLECNVSGEEAKHGFNGYNWQNNNRVKDELWEQVASILALPNLRVCGLMTMAPFVDDENIIRPVFAELFALREELQDSFKVDMPELSMGMTNDYVIAIEEGATILRVGRAIFGERQY